MIFLKKAIKNKLYLSFGILFIIALVFTIVMFLPKTKNTILEGTVIDIYYRDSNINKPTILIRNDNSISSVNFIKNIDLEKKNISLNDIVEVYHSGMVAKSYPEIVYGKDIALLEKANKRFDQSNFNMYFLNSTGYYNDETDTFIYKRFKTNTFYSKDEYLKFANMIGIQTHIENNIDLDLVFNENVIVVSYTHMSSTPKLLYYGPYKVNNDVFIQIDISSPENITDDIVLRGTMVIINKDYVTSDIETLGYYVINDVED